MPTEADTCRKFVVPKLLAVGWDDEPHSIAEQRTITDGRIIPAGKGFIRKPPKRVDYLLRYARDFPLAFVVVAANVATWIVFSRDSFDWHAVATVATCVMTLFIQRAEHRDTQAIHAKLDELLRAEGRARNELTKLDEEEPEEIEQHRRKERLGGRNTLQPR